MPLHNLFVVVVSLLRHAGSLITEVQWWYWEIIYKGISKANPAGGAIYLEDLLRRCDVNVVSLVSMLGICSWVHV